MNKQEALEKLKLHQEWRRGAAIEMLNPKEIWESIDKLIEELEWENK